MSTLIWRGGMFSKLRRVGTTSCKVQISIDLKWLTILESKDYRCGLHIDFERGSKTVSSTARDIPAEPAESKLVVHFDETLTLVMTLYKDSSGKYLDKKGKLVLKGLSKVTNTVVKLGSVNLSLHTLADDYEKKNMIFQLGDSKGTTMGTINVATTSKYLGDAADGDDDSSVVSGASRGTFSSASHLDILQALSASSGTQPTGIYRREKASEFSENDTKLCTSMRTDTSRYQGHENFKLPTPSKTAPASASSGENAPINQNKSKLASASYDENAPINQNKSKLASASYDEVSALASINVTPQKDVKESMNPFGGSAEDKSVPLSNKKERRNPFGGNVDKNVLLPKKKAFEANEMYETDNNFDPNPAPVISGTPLDDKDIEILSLKQQLHDAKAFQNAMEDEFQTKITSMIERIIEIEDESDLEHYNHEQQTIKLLKAAGIYEKSGYDLRDSENNLTYSDTWADLFREQTDDERIKVMVLKKCLIQFCNQLTEEENCDLLDAGIVLGVAKNKSYR